MGKNLFDLASGISDDDIVDESVKLLPHNQKLYDDIITQLNKGEHSIFYSEGTGLGKSFVFMKLVQEYFKDARVLYIVPKIAIWNNVCHYKEFDYIADRVTLATFATFNKYPNNNISCADYDIVFVDECHHMLSNIQGKNVKQFLDDMVSWDKYVFGMTATPEIEGVFVDEECFDVSCYGLDMFEAIEQGLMPKMDIAIGIRDEIDIPDNLREKYSISGTQTLLDKVLSDYSHVTHWLAYFTTKEELEQNETEMKELFPKYKILKAYHGLDNTEEIITEFENSIQPVILMSVSMFLEGMHLKNVGGVLLYRNVHKSHTYAQILGRLCVLNQKFVPVIVDVIGSILFLQQFYTPKSNRAPESRRKVYERKDIFDVTARDYKLFDLIEELRSLPLKEYRGVTWRHNLELSSKLAGRSTCASYLHKNPGATENDWIDLQLKDCTYEEFIDNGYRGYYKCKNYLYESYSDLDRQLGVYVGCVAENLRRMPEKSVVEIVELIESGNLGKKSSRGTEEIYKGYNISTYVSLAKDLGMSEKSINSYVHNHNISIKEFIDEHIYRGVPTYTWLSFLVEKGKDKQVLMTYRQQHTVEECIDYALDIMVPYRGIIIGDAVTIGHQLNMNHKVVKNLFEFNNCASMKDFIDKYLDGMLVKEYKGIPILSNQDIANTLNIKYSTFIAQVKSKGIAEAIDFFLKFE